MAEERAKAIVEVDGKQAKDELAELRELAKQYRKELRDMTEKNDLQGVKDLEKKLKEVNTQMANARKTTFDYNQVLKNLSGSTLKDMERAQSALSKELKNTTRGTDEYIKKSKQYSLVRDEIRKAKTEMGMFTVSQNKLVTLFAKGAGFIGGFYGALKIGQGIINSASATSDKFEEILGGIGNGLKFVQRSIATMDFTNFFRNFSEAVKIGREYIRLMDDISNLNRALKIQEADAQSYILDRMLILRDLTKTEKERIKAADEIIAKEDELAQKRVSIAQQSYDALLLKLTDASKLEKEQIENYVRNYDALKPLIAEAEKYNEILEKKLSYELLLKKNMLSPEGKNELASMKQLIAGTTDEVVQMAEEIKGTGKLTEDGGELDQMVQLYIELAAASRSAKENIQDVFTRRSRLLAREDKNSNQLNNQIENGNSDIDGYNIKSLIEDFESFNQEAREAIFNIESEFVQTALTNEEILSKHHIDRIKTDADFELELYRETYEGKLAFLQAMLAKGLISQKEYEREVKLMELDSLQARASAYESFFGSMASIFKKNSIAYKAAIIAEAVAHIVSMIAQATANTVAGGTRALKDYGFPYSLGVMAAVLAAGFGAVSKIKKIQKEGFAFGGYTGPGGKFQPAGIVHKDEYVVNQRQMHTPRIRSLVNIIEQDRLAHLNTDRAGIAVSNVRGYASGGPVTNVQPPNVTVNMDESNKNFFSMIEELRALRQDLSKGIIKAIFDDREVDKITTRQGLISRIKQSVSRQ